MWGTLGTHVIVDIVVASAAPFPLGFSAICWRCACLPCSFKDINKNLKSLLHTHYGPLIVRQVKNMTGLLRSCEGVRDVSKPTERSGFDF